MNNSIKYALRKNGRLVGFDTDSNEEDFRISTIYYLEASSDQTWYVDTPEHAEYVRQNNTEWFNADYETPSHRFSPDELEVVRVENTHIEKIDVNIPTYEEMIKFLHRDEPYTMQSLLGEMDDDSEYSLYDLREMMMHKNKM